MKTDQEYIRKAVELADGWSNQNNSEFFTQRTLIIAPEITFKIPLNGLGLDALAAQLVRQVDASDSAWIEYASLGAASVFGKGNGDSPIAVSDGSDRTMNTIKAIVDSEVLE